MTTAAIAVAIGCQFPLVIGQIFLKRAMADSQTPAKQGQIAHFVAGVGCLSLWFFLWLGLLQQQELSHVFPFEGLNPALMVIAASLFLKERIGASAWAGVALICLGIALVSQT